MSFSEGWSGAAGVLVGVMEEQGGRTWHEHLRGTLWVIYGGLDAPTFVESAIFGRLRAWIDRRKIIDHRLPVSN